MRKTKSQLRAFGYWPDSPAPSHHPPELTLAARRLSANALEELNQAGVTVSLHAGRAHFRSSRIPSRDAKLLIENHGGLIESYLLEQESSR